MAGKNGLSKDKNKEKQNKSQCPEKGKKKSGWENKQSRESKKVEEQKMREQSQKIFKNFFKNDKNIASQSDSGSSTKSEFSEKHCDTKTSKNLNINKVKNGNFKDLVLFVLVTYKNILQQNFQIISIHHLNNFSNQAVNELKTKNFLFAKIQQYLDNR